MRAFCGLRAAAVALALATGCAPVSQQLPYMREGLAMHALSSTGAGKIEHVVYIVQENRSFDDLFQGYPGADTVSSGKTSHGKTIELQPVSLRNKSYDIDHSAQAMFAACNGTGHLPGTKCRMDGFDNEGARRRSSADPQYVYVPHAETQAVFRHGPRVRSGRPHVPVAAGRELRRRTSTSSRRRRTRASNVPPLGWGCAGGPGDYVRTITQQRTYGKQQSACFDYQTLGDELDEAGLSWRFYTSQYGSGSSGRAAFGRRIRPCSISTTGRTGRRTSSRRNCSFITDVRAGKLANFTWITPVCDDSDHRELPRRLRPVVGCGARQRGRQEQVLGFDRSIFVQWDDWGGLYDHVPPPFRGLRRPRLPRAADRDLAVCEAELRFARAVRDGERACGSPRIFSASAHARGRRQARDVAGGRLPRFHAEAAQVRADQGALRRRSSSCTSTATTEHSATIRVASYSSSTGSRDGFCTHEVRARILRRDRRELPRRLIEIEACRPCWSQRRVGRAEPPEAPVVFDEPHDAAELVHGVRDVAALASGAGRHVGRNHEHRHAEARAALLVARIGGGTGS